MTKRFKLHIDWFNYDKTDGEATLSDNGQPLLESDCVEDMRRLKDLLNELHDENEQLKTDKMILEHNHLPVMERKIEKYKMNVDALTETNDLLNEKIETLSDENEQLKKENQRMTDKLNELALEFLNYDMVTMGKATEISEMCYYDFLKYRKDNGNPMELQV